MLIKVVRGKPVNKEIEINTDHVIHVEPLAKGARVSMDTGDVYAFNSDEWRQYQEQIYEPILLTERVAGKSQIGHAFDKAVDKVKDKLNKRK